MFTVVLRSQTKVIQRSRVQLRNCFVAIEPNFVAISSEWLRIAALRRQHIQAGPSNAVPARRVYPAQRRASVASCRNIFEIDGVVGEIGFDHLHRLPRNASEASGSSLIVAAVVAGPSSAGSSSSSSVVGVVGAIAAGNSSANVGATHDEIGERVETVETNYADDHDDHESEASDWSQLYDSDEEDEDDLLSNASSEPSEMRKSKTNF